MKLIIRLFGISALAMILILTIGSMPVPIDSEQIKKNAELLGTTQEVVFNNAQSQSLLTSTEKQEPTYSIGEVNYYVDEIKSPDIPSKKLQLERVITFDDGSQDTKLVQNDLLKLDFISLKDDSRPISKLHLKITLPITREIDSSEGEFSVIFDGTVINFQTPRKTNADVKDGLLTIYDQTIDLKQQLSTKPSGSYVLDFKLGKFFIIDADNSRQYANPSLLYTITLVKSTSQSLVKNESGDFVKVFDFDVPITISANSQKVSGTMCLSACRGGGCCQSYTKETYIPSPAIGSMTITDLKTNKVVASSPAIPAGVCASSDSRYSGGIYGGLSVCDSVTGGGSLSFNAQRGQSYKITVSDPATSWIINVPESGGAYNYSCIDHRTSIVKSVNIYGVENYGWTSERSCNF
jgi:hypothetical protein